MTQVDWRPSMTLERIRGRSQLIQDVRQFFIDRGLLEVDTPSLMPNTVTDPHMQALAVPYRSGELYLQTSPEYAIKRLLAAGVGDCFQLGKSFRAEEIGRHHQIEFTLLEWYRIGWDEHQLMQEVAELVRTFAPVEQINKLTYRQAFIDALEIDPITASESLLNDAATRLLGPLPQQLDRDDLLSLLFSQSVEKTFDPNALTLVNDFPASQGALAELNQDGLTARRFEAYAFGLELANGFYELTDAPQQAQRFALDNLRRAELSRPHIEPDPSFLAALEAGLPVCSGVALGVERLMMAAWQLDDIRQVSHFPL